jgi:hypothetical protein
VSGASRTTRLLLGALLAGACWLGATSLAAAQPNPAEGPTDAPALRGTAGGATGAGTAAGERSGPLSPRALFPLVLLVGGAVTGAGMALARRAATEPIGVNGQPLEPAPAPVAAAHADVAGELGLSGEGRPARRPSAGPRSVATDPGVDERSDEDDDVRARRSAGLVDLSGIEGVLGPRPPAGPPPAARADGPAIDLRETAADRPDRDEPPVERLRVDVSGPLFPEAPVAGARSGEATADQGEFAAEAVVALSAGDLRWKRGHHATGDGSAAPAGPAGTDVDADPAPARGGSHPAS